jgi:FMN phosphatase YigB (HAD superfamily)
MKYLALDIGNVLCTVDFYKFKKLLSSSMNLSFDEVDYFLHRAQKLHDLGLTNIEYELRDYLKIKSDSLITDLLCEWDVCVKPHNDTIKRIVEWQKDYDLKVALLSNIGLEHANQMPLILSYGFFYDKAVKHFSCEVGARKPSLIYYQSFLHQFPEFYGCVYVDDLAENLEASKKFGFKTFQFSLENKNITQELDKLEELVTKWNS